MPEPRIDGDRLWDRLLALGRIGATGRGGVDRQALTEGEAQAWWQLIVWGSEHGLLAHTDAAGNLFLTLPGVNPALPPVLVGSHVDTQPTGGLFDGALGVLAGLEAACAMVDAGARGRRGLIIAAWMNEEGSRFAPGMMGSGLFAGTRSLQEVRAVRDAAGISVGDALDRLHATVPLPRRAIGFPFSAYLELHIEQGTKLEQAGLKIGVVTGVQGKKTWRVALTGAEDHAGTVDMAVRRDAVAAMARIVAELHATVGQTDNVKFTVGRVVVEPNAPSVVAGRASFSMDLRHPENATLDRLGLEVEATLTRLAPPCALDYARLVDAPTVVFDAGLQDRLELAATQCGFEAMRLPSAAGHAARHMAALAPTAMVFIPCRGGLSHAEQEWAEPEHVTAGAEVLMAALLPLLQA